MKEYIERAEALDICQKEYEDRLRMADYCGDTVALDIGGVIKGIPAADVAEGRHGRWILEREPDGTPYCFHCSVCDNDFHHIGIMTATDYCPNCGARMDKEATNNER